MSTKAHIILTVCILFSIARTAAQPGVKWNTAPLRSEFISYSTRDNAVSGNRGAEQYFMPVEDFKQGSRDRNTLYAATFEIPEYWLEREVFLHIEGNRNSHIVYVNDIPVGSARDSRLPSEFNLSGKLVPGTNTLLVEIPYDTAEPESGLAPDGRQRLESVYIYSQPRIRIEDFTLRAVPESDTTGMLTLEVTMRNSYNYAENASIGYDVYSPEGKLLHFDIKEVEIEGRSSQTITMWTRIYAKKLPVWSAGSPALYDVMMFVRHGGINKEYIPFRTGFVAAKADNGMLLVNGVPVSVNAARYNSPASRQKAAAELAALKKSGINTLYPDYPQPYWFYELCDASGFYVVEQVNVNTPAGDDNRAVGGTLSNDPAWLPEYLIRTESAYRRSHNHPCIIAWSLGGESGNGYNLYKTYQWLRNHDERPVVYRFAQGEWNNDLRLPAPVPQTNNKSVKK